MNILEMGKLLAYVAGACPQQKMNAATPDAWGDILGNLEYEECKAAAAAIAARQPFVAPSEIIREIADSRAAGKPHSNACRAADCADCRVSWCGCACHARNVQAVTKPRPERAAIAGADMWQLPK